jgi:hypothetical protein
MIGFCKTPDGKLDASQLCEYDMANKQMNKSNVDMVEGSESLSYNVSSGYMHHSIAV